jgi:hypothetical protein
MVERGGRNQFAVAPRRPRATSRDSIGETSYGCRTYQSLSSYETKENTPIYGALHTSKLMFRNRQPAVLQQQSHILICFISPCGEERETWVPSISAKSSQEIPNEYNSENVGYGGHGSRIAERWRGIGGQRADSADGGANGSGCCWCTSVFIHYH